MEIISQIQGELVDHLCAPWVSEPDCAHLTDPTFYAPAILGVALYPIEQYKFVCVCQHFSAILGQTPSPK